MKNIIIRAGMSPLDTFDAPYILNHNSIGGNVGNLIYQYSVYRTLMTKDTTITPDYYNYEPSRAEEINEKYDCYVIPLADAFRTEFMPSLRKYTQLIKKLTIPVYVIGVGLRAPFEPKLDEGFPFDEDVKAFMKAILDKSSMVGLRGEITSEYLTKLGFKEGVDHTVIGCPSMYTFGKELKIRQTNITKDSLICVNSSKISPKNVLDFITRGMKEYPNHYFIPQWLKELKLVHLGSPSIAKDSENYPVKMSDSTYMNDRVRYPLNAPTWLDFIRKADLSFGARLHGNIAATISGTPSIIIPKDARMRELAEYHQLTHVMAKDIKDKTRLSDLIEQVDFQSPTERQAKNFDHYIGFLNKNNIEHIYKGNNSPTFIPLEERLSNVKLLPLEVPISGCNIENIVGRWENYYQVEDPIQVQLENLEKTVKEKDKKIKRLEGQLNRKSVKLVLKATKIFTK